MFRQRTSSQKPGDELLANFRQQFPQVTTSGPLSTAAPQPSLIADNSALGHPAPAPEHISSHQSHHQSHQNAAPDAFRDQDPTPRATAPEWRFTPSLLDPNSYAFHNFANQQPGYYTPTPGGTNTLYHPQAGDLHTTPTPSHTLAMGLNTPLSLPTSDNALHAGPGLMDMSHFQPTMASQPFHTFNPFVQAAPQQPSFAPSSFVHHDTGYETMDHDGSPLGSEGTIERMGSMDAAFHSQSPPNNMFPRFGLGVPNAPPPNADIFRFQCTLNAPTAMIKSAHEIPVTYLNKGQAYSLAIVDSGATVPINPGTKYRTFVRISFEDERQRDRPGVCWSLWKEGRGSNEAHQRGGKLQAVEYVEAGQSIDPNDKRARIELESSSFDGFCVTWTPGANGTADCTIAVRFNFLSTDFSHSKGVKGIPVRLCAKTSIVSTADSSPSSPPDAEPEICYCKVKLFRDHGAERKLANDVAHVKKLIDKINQQIQQAGSGGKEFGKRKRGITHSKGQEHQRPGKAPKHKRTWSMSSVSSTDGGDNARQTLEDDLQVKLQTTTDMFSSPRPMSVLYLRGEEKDDPDLYPVHLPGEPADLARVDSKEGAPWPGRSARNSIVESPLASASPSSLSLHSQNTGAVWGSGPRGSESRQPIERPIKVPRMDEDGGLAGWIESIGVDPSYKPPAETPPKAIACFHIARKQPTDADERVLHRAVYLTERNLANFVARVSAKWDIDVAKVTRAVHVLGNGLEVEMDDDVIRELSEGQDMILDVEEADLNMPQTKSDWEMAVDLTDGDGNSPHSAYRTTTGYELRFSF
ncbi:CP2 transcription factor-domain-containing protein [Nemania sp. FL0916]|nr:CP2 transcription factor-domain-containing protein [Nemania sp. FL0916]